jgi:ParB-like nuclease family protein
VAQTPSTLAEEGLLPSSDLSAIRSRLRLVELESLLTYELPDPQRVAQILVSLRRTRQLVNPIVVDLDLGLLVDGHHRVEAFRRLGLRQIPAYAIDYRSAAVEVRGWSRATIAAQSDVAWAFDVPPIQPSGRWSVVLASFDRHVVARRFFTDAKSAAVCLQQLTHDLIAIGLKVTLETSPMPSVSGQICSRVDPVIGKAEVIAAAQAADPFPCDVNRHLVDARPVGMSIPLASIERPRDFHGHIDHLFEHCIPTLADPGTHHDGRQYDERVTLFALTDASRSQPAKLDASRRHASSPR